MTRTPPPEIARATAGPLARREAGPGGGRFAGRLCFAVLLAAQAPSRSAAAPSPAPPAVPAAFQAAPAVVLEDTHDLTHLSTRAECRRKVRIQILDRRGFSHADQVVYYERKSAKIRDFRARTIRSDGSVVEVPADLRHDVIAMQNDAQEFHALLFTFPAVEIGAILEWQYEIAYDDQRWVLPWEIQREIPVVETRFIARRHWAAGTFPSVEFVSRRSTTAWCMAAHSEPEEGDKRIVIGERLCRSVPAYPDESYSPPEADSRLQALMTLNYPGVSYPERIRAFRNGEWGSKIESCTKKRNLVRSTGRRIASEAASAPERIDRVFKYVTENITVRDWSELSESLTGARPCRDVDEVMASKGGSSDELALLTLALLEEAGVPARIVLVADRAGGRFDATIPESDQYRHPLVEVGPKASPGYLDPSCKYCMPGAPDWRYCGDGSGGLRVDRRLLQPEVVQLAGVPPEVNAERIQQTVRLGADGSARVEGTVVWQAQFDTAMREAMEDLTEEGREDLFIEGVTGEIEDTHVSVADPDNLRENLRVEFDFHQRDLAVSVAGRILARAPDVFTGRAGLPVQEERKLAIWWPFARSMRVECVFVLPQGSRVDRLPADVVTTGPGLRFEAAWTEGKPGEVLWKGLLTVSRTTIRAEDYDRAREFLAGVHGALRQVMVLEVPGGAAGGGAE